TGEAVRRFRTPAHRGVAAWLPAGDAFCAADEDGLRFWDVRTGLASQHWRQDAGWVSELAFSADGKALALWGSPTSKEYLAEVHDVATGKRLARLELPHKRHASVAISHDGKALLSWDPHAGIFTRQEDKPLEGGGVLVWDVGRAKVSRTLLPDV